MTLYFQVQFLKLQYTEITKIKDKDIRIFYKDFSVSEGLSSKEMINFSDTDEHEDAAESIFKNFIWNKLEYCSVEDPLSMHRTASNEKLLFQEFHM